MYTTRYTLGQIEHLKRACAILKQHIDDVGRGLDGTEVLTPMEEGLITNANLKATLTCEHIELATRYAYEWEKAVWEVVVLLEGRKQEEMW